MILLADFGNTRVKAAVLENGSLTHVDDMMKADVNGGMWCSVHPLESKVTEWMTAHGMKQLTADTTDADYLILEIDGILVPFFMEEYRFRNDSLALVKFCDVDTQQRASELTGCDVYFPRSVADEGTEGLSLSMLVGFDIVDASDNKVVGKIAAIDDSTQNVLFELEDGTLIPASDDLITNIDTNRRQIIMQIPEGLLALR